VERVCWEDVSSYKLLTGFADLAPKKVDTRLGKKSFLVRKFERADENLVESRGARRAFALLSGASVGRRCLSNHRAGISRFVSRRLHLS